MVGKVDVPSPRRRSARASGMWPMAFGEAVLRHRPHG
jgi:hypothetical protein